MRSALQLAFSTDSNGLAFKQILYDVPSFPQ